MLKHGFFLVLLAGMLFPSQAAAQSGRRVAITLVGTLTVTAKEGVSLPETFVVVLSGTDKREFARQPVANHGTFRFERVENGDWEIAVEAEGTKLGRVSFTLAESRSSEIRKDLELEYRPKQVAEATVSAADTYPRNPENSALMAQAMAAGGKKNYGEAEKQLKALVKADPKDFEGWTEFGNVLFRQGKLGEAEKAFQQALAERPSYPLALLNLGKLKYEQKEYEDAITAFERLVTAHPESAEGHRFLGESFLRIKKGSKAVPELEEAARLDPDRQAEAYLSLGALYEAAGLKDKAAGEYEKFLVKKPGYANRKKLEEFIRQNKKQ